MDPVSMLERQNLYGTAAEEHAAEAGAGQNGYRSLGAALVPGASEMQGEMAETRGELMGAQTVSALAQARQRVTENQNAESAAAAMRSPQLQQALGINDEVGNFAATMTLAGHKPEEVTQFLQGIQHYTNRQKLGDPNADPRERLGAAFSENPAEAVPKNVGLAGSHTDPLTYNPADESSFEYISPEQHAMNQSLVSERGAQAAAAGERAKGAPGGPKLATGYRWKTDENGDIMYDGNNSPIQEPNPAAGTGAVARRYVQSVINAGEGIDSEVQNIRALATKDGEPDRGFTQFGNGAHPGLLATAKNNLGLALSSNVQQHYSASVANLARYLQTVEQAGQKPNQRTIDDMSSIINNPGTTQEQRLYNMGLVRQGLENGLRAIQVNPDATPKSIAEYRRFTTEVRGLVPYLPNDVSDFETHGQPGEAFGAYLSRVKGHGTATPAPAGGNAPPAPAGGAAPMSLDDYLKSKGH
jgi:hypothetical protein